MRPGQRTPAWPLAGWAVRRATRTDLLNAVLQPGGPKPGSCLCAAAPGRHGLFVEHLVCEWWTFESVGLREI
jgi:hypothetical protein